MSSIDEGEQSLAKIADWGPAEGMVHPRLGVEFAGEAGEVLSQRRAQ